MKKIFSHISKSTLLALAFFGIMTLMGISTAHAQNDTINPLLSTTGSNVLGAGSIQWNSTLDYYYTYSSVFQDSYMSVNAFGASTGLRLGVGSRAELTLDVAGSYNALKTQNLNGPCVNTKNFNPTVGVKLLLADNRGWLPQVAFFTHVGMAIDQSRYSPTVWTRMVQPEIGFMFRNRLGSRNVLDYSIGYSWNRESGYNNNFESLFQNQIQYSVFYRRLVTDRFMTGVGVSNANSAQRLGGGFEFRYLPNPDLQLSLLVGGAFGAAKDSHAAQANAQFGLHWTLR